MKKLIFLLTSLTSLLVTSHAIVDMTQENFLTKKLSNNISRQETKSLFNNKYGNLNNDEWITNQSQSDQKFYSYDTMYADFDLSDKKTKAKMVFMVDNNGNLIYDPSVKILPQDKFNLDNAKEEMISNQKVTTINNNYNPFSRSEYSDTYFSGQNSDWKFLQFGGIEKTIDISKQQAGNKVEHNNSLSEALGLYYIAKAVRTPGGIDEKVADNLGQYFISQSTLTDSFNKTGLTTKIIDLVATNSDIYNFIYYAPFVWNSKNYVLNFIFDGDNNLVQISYRGWKTDDYTTNVNVNYYKTYNGTNSGDNHVTSTQIVFPFWTDYTNNWDDFVKLFPTIIFDSKSVLTVKSQYDNKTLTPPTVNTKNITSTINNVVGVSIKHDGGFFGAYVYVNAIINIWHDDHNVYFNAQIFESSSNATEGCSIYILLNNLTFNNGMK